MGRVPTWRETGGMKHAIDNSWDQAKHLGDELFDLQRKQLDAKTSEVFVHMTTRERMDYVRRQNRISEIFRLLAYQRAA
jgi:hypothetical protein